MLSLQREIDHYEHLQQRRCNVIARYVIDGEREKAEAYAKQYPSLESDIERLYQNSVDLSEVPACREVKQTQAIRNLKKKLFAHISYLCFTGPYNAYAFGQAIADIQRDLDWDTFFRDKG